MGLTWGEHVQVCVLLVRQSVSRGLTRPQAVVRDCDCGDVCPTLGAVACHSAECVYCWWRRLGMFHWCARVAGLEERPLCNSTEHACWKRGPK
jgi:hypothetical protein